ncbi:unnamed protein product [Haemonchus placei]|uniref:Cytochrome P450 n=1 Tax=Haemonchus placei TaxID=6290 RepID=A0A0N4W663_HAEPC|nr:unnamed protein product [Haemonchus placei]
MVPIFNECSKICTAIIDQYALDGRPAPIKDIITRLTLDMTAKCAFGYDFDVQHNLTSPFLEFARKFSEVDLRSPEVALIILFPNICAAFQRITGISILNHAANKFFLDVLERLFDDRKKGNQLKYNDFFQILLNSLVEDNHNKPNEDETESELPNSARCLSKGDILGQAFMFVLAGFETTPAALHLTVYMLAVHRVFQKRCREEIERVCGKKDDISYEMLSEMKYMEQCISETLRMYPPVVRTNRLCTKNVTVKGIEMKEGCVFTIPIRAIHYNEDFYPSPNDFDPERSVAEPVRTPLTDTVNCCYRWSSSNRSNRDPLTYLPFGYGPRNCIGMRVAQMQMKMALAHILRTFEMRPGEKIDLPLQIDSVGSMRTVEDLSVIFTKL